MPANNVINALKARNAIVMAPSPKGAGTCARLLQFIHAELAKVGLPADLVQMLPLPANKQQTAELMRGADLVAATGSRANVRAAYASGTPSLGVGAGNVAAIVTPAADMGLMTARLAASKTFDNATSCSSENSLVVIGEAWRPLLAALEAEGGALLDAEDAARLRNAMFPDGRLAAEAVGRDGPSLARLAGLRRAECAAARFLMLEQQPEQIGPDHPFSGEKLSPALALYRARDFVG
jgi:sulfoacetaldehyde dehydrogenase